MTEPEADDAGYTLVELLVVVILLTITGTIITNLMIGGLKQQTQITERITSVNDLRKVMERLTREVRNSTSRPGALDNSLALCQQGPTNTRGCVQGATDYKTEAYALQNLTSGLALVLDEVDVDTAGHSSIKARAVILANVPAGAATTFVYGPVGSYVAPAGVPINPLTCAVTGSTPTAYANTCIGTVTITLTTKITHGSAAVALTDTVELRNVG